MKDLVSLASQLKRAKFYYVAKELRVYEISSSKESTRNSNHSSSNQTNPRKKLIKVSPGSVIKALQVVSVDYEENANKTFYGRLKNLVCCDFGKKDAKKSHPCIELKIIENFDELSYLDKARMIKNNSSTGSEFESAKSDLRYEPNEENLPKAKPNETTYYLPLNETDQNVDIDLIPISLRFLQNQHMLKTNSLQVIKNFAINDQLIDENYVELKLVDENPFKGKNFYNSHSSTKFTNSAFSFTSIDEAASKSMLLKEDQHLELSKYKSIFDVIDFKSSCQILVGFSLKTNQLFMMPIDSVKKLQKPDFQCVYQKVGAEDAEQNQHILRFKATHLEKFLKIAQIEMDSFEKKLHKIQVSMFDTGPSSEIQSIPDSKFIKKNVSIIREASQDHVFITHFADLANVAVLESCTDKSVEIRVEDSGVDEKARVVKSERALKYSTMPCRGASKVEGMEMVQRDHVLDNFVEVEIERHSDDYNEDEERNGAEEDGNSSSEIISRLQLRGNLRSSSMPNKVAKQLRENSRVLRNSGKKI